MKKFLIIFLNIALFIQLFSSGLIFSPKIANALGSGTVEDPYVVSTLTDLQNIKNNLSAHYILANDIDASATSTWNEDPGNPGTYFGFEPIGNQTNKFTGSFDGQGNKITSLYINRPLENDVALFGATRESAEIKDIGIIDGSINGYFTTGRLVGHNTGTITNSYAKDGSVSSNGTYVGGLVGFTNGSVTNSYSTGSIISSNMWAGGLAGEGGGTIANSYSTNTVISTSSVAGGLIGGDDGATITNSYSSGSVTGTSIVGGLVGHHNSATITNSYSMGDVSGTSYVGGLVGKIISLGSTITNSYSMGDVSGTSYVGGLVGLGESTYPNSVINSFWNTQTSGQAGSDGGTGKTTVEMKAVATFTDTDTIGLTSAWDFVGNPNDDIASDDIWHILPSINGGYPFIGALYTNKPDAPSNLSPNTLINGSYITDNTPTLTFTLNDSDVGQTVQYHIQISNFIDFSSPVVDFTSGLGTQGEKSFTVGQALNGGTYTAGQESQTIPGNNNFQYYWRVMAKDDYGTTSNWTTANTGAIAFRYAIGLEGSGTQGNPYVVYNINDLQFISRDLSAHYILANDIDASATSTWNEDPGNPGTYFGFEPIGNQTNKFTGSFDGQGNKITSLYINRPLENDVALFGATRESAEIKDIGIIDISINGFYYVGGLVAQNYGTISKSYVTGLGNGAIVGGLVGENYGTISNSYFIGSITGSFRVGGLSGTNTGTINNSYVSDGGGGGAVIGGFVAENSGTVSDSFWNMECSGLVWSAGGTGKTTTEMKSVTTFTDSGTEGLTNPWDFSFNPNDDTANENIWGIDSDGVKNNGYPYLSWQYPDTTAPTLTITSPTNGSSTITSSVTVTGTAIDGESGVASLTINGISISNPASFSTSVSLNMGENTFIITATDSSNNSTTRTLSITRIAPNIPAIIQSASSSRARAASMIGSILSSASASSVVSTFSISDPSLPSSSTLMNPEIMSAFTTQFPILKGRTTPFARIFIEIHSDPITAQTNANENGDWEYKVTEPLSFGEHSIKIIIKEKDTENIISQETYKINIIDKAKAENKNNEQTQDNYNNLFAIITIAFIVLIGAVFYLRKRVR